VARRGVEINPKRLRQRREARGFSHAALAYYIGRSVEACRQMECGDMRPSPVTLRRLCIVLDCDPEDLLEDGGDA
jgi:transcriptional regulator with XRE-family HTH domain